MNGASFGPPKAVVFDWDNTLVDSWQVIHEALRETLVAFGLKPWTIEQTKGWVRRSMREAFPGLFGANAEAAAARFYRAYRSLHLSNVRLMPETTALLDGLARRGAYLAVLSSKNGDLLRAEAEHLGVADYFARLGGATDTPEDKPSPLAMAHVLEPGRLAGGPDVWYVGDTGIDVVCARRAGCVSVVVGALPALDGDEAHEPDLHFSSLADLMAFVSGFGHTI
ncbi:MAG: HAD family hydrolase [Alphaproteobacteria bacterium]